MLVKRGMQKLPFFPTFEDQKRQLLHPQHAKHHPGHLQDDAGEAGDAKAAFFYNDGRPKGSPRIPSMQSIAPGTCTLKTLAPILLRDGEGLRPLGVACRR